MSVPVRAQTATLVAAAAARSCSVVLLGPPGIGKTYHLDALLAGVRARGWRVLLARPVEAESRLGGCALLDLLADVSDTELADLPAPQRDALGAVLLRAPAAGPFDHRVVGVALTGLLTGIARRGPVVVAVDDAHWLDVLTRAALRFAARRLPPAGVALVTTLRDSATREALVDDNAERLVVAPLPAAETAALVRAYGGGRLTPEQQAYAVTASAGNPLFARELAEWLRDGAGATPDPLALPPALDEVIGARVRALPPRTRDCVAAAAALARPSLPLLARLGLADDVPAAERAGVLSVEREHVRFTHPLLAAASYSRLTGSERSALHARLAAVVPSPEERARHLALASDEPDRGVATALDEAAHRALSRGDVAAAVDALRLAVGATPPEDPHEGERRLALGLALVRAGDARGARRELFVVAQPRWPAALRARALVALAAHQLGWAGAAVDQAREAVVLAAAGADPLLRVDAELALAQALHDDLPAAERHTRRALDLLAALPEPPAPRTAQALQLLAETRFYRGLDDDEQSWRRAADLERVSPPGPIVGCVALRHGVVRKYADDLAGAREVLTGLLARSLAEHDGSAVPLLVFHLSELELLAGDLAAARRLNEEHRELAESAGGVANGMYRVAHCYLLLAESNFAAAAARARQVLADAMARGSAVGERHARIVLGSAALADGDAAEAVAQLTAVDRALDRAGIDEPSRRRHTGDLVEALLATGQVDRAGQHADRLSAAATRCGRRSALGIALRSRALVLAAQGDPARALDAVATALACYDEPSFFPLDRARALLVEGRLRRRLRQKAAARDVLLAARAEFDRLGAAALREGATEELARVGLRPPAPSELTETERRVAELVASGMRTRDAAAALFISPATVSANLSRIYRKLGISSRAQLGARLGGISGYIGPETDHGHHAISPIQ